VHILSAKTRVAGVIGWPVAQSRSPLLHNFWLVRHNIDGAYLAFPVEPGKVETAIRGLAAAGLIGVNVTIPHKLEVVALCDEITDFARHVGAVNSLSFSHNKILGDNTDGFGFISNLRAHQIDPSAGPALVLGAGGAARAVVASLQDAGVSVTVANRTRSRAEVLCREFDRAHVLDWNRVPERLCEFSLMVNTTAAGMQGGAALNISLEGASPQLSVADIVYVPRETSLIRDAAARGLRTAPGLGMLLHQGRRSFAGWFGIEPIVDQEVIDYVAGDIPIKEC